MRNRPTAKRQKSEKKSTKNRAKIDGKSMKNRPETVPGDPRSSSEATGAQKSRKKTQKSRFWEPPGDAQETQNSSKNILKKHLKTVPSKNNIFSQFKRFSILPASIFMDFGTQNGCPDHRFLTIFWDRVFASIFGDFCCKKEKTQKMKK